MAEVLIGGTPPGVPIRSYNLTVETKINIDELIYTLSPDDLPLLSGIGSDGMPVLRKQPVDNTIFYWMEDSVPLPRATLAVALADATGTAVQVGVGEGVKFRLGDAIRIDGEVMKVDGRNAGNPDILTVQRGTALVSNTTGATHALGAEVVGLGSVILEGETTPANYTGRDRYFNYTQIWTATLEVTRTEQSIPKYGVPNELNKQVINNTQVTNLDMEQAALYGVRHLETATNERQTGGLDYFIVSNVNSTDAHITVAGVELMQSNIFDKGGTIKYIMSRPSNFRALNNIAGNERVQTVTVDDAKRGRRRAQTVMTEFGEVELVRNRWVRKKDAFTFGPDNFIHRVFQPLILQRLAKVKDTDSYMMVAEGGFEVKGEGHCGKWTALDASAALPAGLV